MPRPFHYQPHSKQDDAYERGRHSTNQTARDNENEQRAEQP
ncbi:hypothetical protein [Xylella fastidiosa]|nr:hypothetical protein [Xylella fastidiosa]